MMNRIVRGFSLYYMYFKQNRSMGFLNVTSSDRNKLRPVTRPHLNLFI